MPPPTPPCRVRSGGLVRGVLQRRYKRFLADVTLDDGSFVTASVPNPGRMTGGDEGVAELGYAPPGSTVVYLERTDARTCKHRFRWLFAVEPASGALVCVHTLMANRLARAALASRRILLDEAAGRGNDASLSRRCVVRPEQRYPDSTSRCDFLLLDDDDDGDGNGETYVEVKSVTMAPSTRGLVMFPDAVSARARRHLDELARVLTTPTTTTTSATTARPTAGLPPGAPRRRRAYCVFLVQRDDEPLGMCPAERIDAAFAAAMRHAASCGVEFACYWLRPSVSATGANGGAAGEYEGTVELMPRRIPVFFSPEEARACLSAASSSD